MKVFVLRNEELGYIDYCPVFLSKKEAENEAAGKCHRYSVKAIDDSRTKACHPIEKYPKCASCCRFDGVMER